MNKIGIDVGSTFTKYCILDESSGRMELFKEKTPARQQTFFKDKIAELKEKYDTEKIISCGYGKNNIPGIGSINELQALSAGASLVCPEAYCILDIGGQDSKLIVQENGKLKKFFLNDKCAAGSGQFLLNSCHQLEISLDSINLLDAGEPNDKLSSVCAVFANTEIVEAIAANRNPDELISSVIWAILVKAKALLRKTDCPRLFLSGGLTQIPGYEHFAEKALEVECHSLNNGIYTAAIGSAVSAG